MPGGGGGNLTSVVVVGVGNLTPDGRGGGNLIDLPRFHVTLCVVSFITRTMGFQKAKQTRARNKERSK